MQDNKLIPCEQLIPYITGDCTKEEWASFEDHLQICPSCRQEVEELKVVMNALPWRMEQMEAPGDLKAEIMNEIFQSETMSGVEESANRLNHKKKRIRSGGRGWTASLAAAVVLVVIIGTIWNYTLFQKREMENVLDQPAQVEVVYTLTAASAQLQGSGKACIVKQGDKKKLIVYLYDLSVTEGEEAYQVWLIREGKRKNAGTFHVNGSGFGVLTYELPETETTFDAIGITLEPDPRGSQPRGTKVLGT